MASKDILNDLERMVVQQVLPIARRYDYNPQSLAPHTRWKPIVLIIGNYSSGKSTLINELLGTQVQRTGQAPTDDCFTILMGADDPSKPPGTVEQQPGSSIVNDASMPFAGFKKFGNSFVSHFVLKRVNSPKLKDLAIIDSPGMLDSVTELDRGYDYQAAVGQLAELADLVVLVFDPHKAGTIKETYVSIRSTLPKATSEDRVVFVMNRIDECKNLSDLVRCYGGLCWNLSQMTGRKDIPRVYLTYSPELGRDDPTLRELADERVELIKKIEDAPRLQVSHALGSVDNHLHKLELIAQALANASARFRSNTLLYLQIAVVVCLLAAIGSDLAVAFTVTQPSDSLLGRLYRGQHTIAAFIVPVLVLLVGLAGFYFAYHRVWFPRFHRRLKAEPDRLVDLDSRYARDLWDSLRSKVVELLDDPNNLSPFAPHRSFAAKIRKLLDENLKRLYERHLGDSLPRS